MRAKQPSDSCTTMTHLVMPNDANNLDNLMGGNLLKWMDVCAAIAAGKHANAVAVTAAVDNVSFKHPIRRGQIVTLISTVTRAFNTSMEVYTEVFAEDLSTQQKIRSNTAYYTFVALSDAGRPIKAPALEPETEKQQKQFDGALRRRELRLVLSGRMKPEEATELKAMFLTDVIQPDDTAEEG